MSPVAFGGGSSAPRSYVQGTTVTLPVVVTGGVTDSFTYGGNTYTVRPGTYTSLVAWAGAISDAQWQGHDFGQAVVVAASGNGLRYTSVPSGAIATAFTGITAPLGLTNGQTIASTSLATANATFGGFAYTGARPDIAALTSAELVDIFAYAPFQAGINQAQYDTHLEEAYFMRHVFDSLNTDPFS